MKRLVYFSFFSSLIVMCLFGSCVFFIEPEEIVVVSISNMTNEDLEIDTGLYIFIDIYLKRDYIANIAVLKDYRVSATGVDTNRSYGFKCFFANGETWDIF